MTWHANLRGDWRTPPVADQRLATAAKFLERVVGLGVLQKSN